MSSVKQITCQQPCPRCSALDERLAVERVARLFHYFYEMFAPFEGWETREETRKAWDDLPGANRLLMLRTVAAVIDEIKRGV